jgi:undecaprenyl-diphosphatase
VPALSRRRTAELLAGIAALFVLCTAVTAAGALDGLDHDMAGLTSRTTGHAANVALSIAALPASVPLSLAWLGLLAAGALMARRGCRRVAVLAAALAVASLLEVALKLVLDHPGPGRARTIIALGLEPVGEGSFPSGHMLRGTALAFGTALLLGRRPGGAGPAIAAVYTAALALTRLYLNEHWASDVLGGLLLGLAVTLTMAAAPRARRRPDA